MKRHLLLIIAFTLQLFPNTVQADSDMKIGVSAPLTGPAAAWGIDLKNVLIFANEKLAQSSYRFIFEDDKCSPKEAVSIAQKFTRVDKVQASFIVCGATTIASAPVYDRAGVVLMAPIATPTSISQAGDYIFRPGLSDAFATRKLAEHISKGHKKVGVLTEQNDYSVSFLKDFEKEARIWGLETLNEDFQSSDTDFKTQILRLKSKDIDALFINSNTERLYSIVLKQVRSLKIELPIFGAYLPGTSAFISLAGADANGIQFVDFPLAEQLISAEGRKLYEEYIERFGKPKSWDYAFPAVFEAFRALHTALQSGGSPKDFLYRTKFQGIFGPYSFDSNGDLVGLSHAMKVILDGKSTTLETSKKAET